MELEKQLAFDFYEQAVIEQERKKRLDEVISAVTFATLFGGVGSILLYSVIPPEARESFSHHNMARETVATAATFGGSMYIVFKIQDAYRYITNKIHPK